MAILSKGTTFTTSQQVTSANLNALVDSATFVSGSSGTTDDSTLEVNGSGRLQIKDLGITTAKLAALSITAAKIGDGEVTAAKLSTGAPTWNGTNTVTVSFADVNSTLFVTNTSSTATRLPAVTITNYADTFGGYPVFNLRASRGNSVTPSAIQSGDSLGRVNFTTHDGSGFEVSGFVEGLATENHSGSARGASVRFVTVPNGSTTGAERFRISETGGLMIGTATDVPSAILALSSTTKGLRLPVMTTTQKNAISSPAEGLLIYDTTLNKLCFYTGAAWETVTSA